jgi:hypothetical protein
MIKKFVSFLVVFMIVASVEAEDNYFVKCSKSESRNLCARSDKISVKKIKSGRESFYCIFYDASYASEDDPYDDVAITLANGDWTVQAVGRMNTSDESRVEY